ncbi:MAG: FAD-dependent oxidoreductase, partial [Fimbriimonadales bacterium]|nr:FAD-dependent oxidoreductase [Fimbriimonadales bacterium]
YGAVVHENTRVVRIEPLPNHVVLETEPGALERFDRVLITAGAWIPKLLPELNLPLTVTRQTYAYFAVQQGAESHFEPACMPVWIEATRHFYGFPNDGRQTGVKIALHQLGEAHDPDLSARPVDENDLAPLRACIQRRLPEVSETVLHTGTCLYTNAPDEKFLIQPLPGDSRVWFVSACSGHGFKFSILNGYEAARQVVSEA